MDGERIFKIEPVKYLKTNLGEFNFEELYTNIDDLSDTDYWGSYVEVYDDKMREWLIKEGFAIFAKPSNGSRVNKRLCEADTYSEKLKEFINKFIS